MSESVKEAAAGRALARSAGLVSGLTLLSRLLGLVREQVFAALLGAGLHADAFQIAFRVPNLLRDLFAEGALSAAFVPTYARTLASDGREGAHRLASRLFTLLAVLVGALTLLGLLAARPRWSRRCRASSGLPRSTSRLADARDAAPSSLESPSPRSRWAC